MSDTQNRAVQYRLLSPDFSNPVLAEPIGALCRLVSGGRALPEKYAAPLRALENWLVNLPAAQSYYAEEGGAVAYALVTATNAARIASSSIFAPTAPNEQRALLQPQYEYAAFLAGLSCVLAFPPREVRINAVGKPAWNSLLGPLRSYVAVGDSYSVTWLQRASTSRVPSTSHGAWVGAVAMLTFAQQYLTDQDVAREFVSAIMPDAQPTAGEPLLVQIVRRACLKSVADYKTALAESTVLPARAPARTDDSNDVLIVAVSPPQSVNSNHNAPPTQAPKTAALSDLQNTIASVRLNGQSAMSTPPTAKTVQKSESAVPDERVVGNDLMANFSPWAREFFQSLRDDVAARDPVIRKMRVDDAGKGFILQRQMITHRGLDDNKVSDYLHSHGLLVQKLATSLIVDHRMGAFITTDGEHTVGAHEKPAGGR